MKYIHSKDHGIVMFEVRHKHSDMALFLRLEPADIVSAGFVDIADPSQIVCKGESQSLAKTAGAFDAKRLQSNFMVGRSMRGGI